MTYFVHYEDNLNVRRVNNVLHICTSNDANGKPRRLIVCLGSYGTSLQLSTKGVIGADFINSIKISPVGQIGTAFV